MNVLQRPVLVLNKGWHPVDVVNVERAIKMCMGEWADANGKMHPKVEIVNHKDWSLLNWEAWSELPISPDDAVIRSAHRAYLAPEIVVANRYAKINHHRQTNFNKGNLFKRDKHTCLYCGVQFPPSALSIDHIIPKSRGGGNNWENCCTCCYKCNQKKRNRTPKEASMKEPKVSKPGPEIMQETNIRLESWRKFFGEV